MPRLRGNTGLFDHFHGGWARYRAVLSLPGAAAFFATAAVARLGVAMTILGVLWAVRGATGSFASAGVATAVFALADATAGPQVARLVEDRGQRRILPWSVAVFVLAVSGLIAGAGLRLPLAVLALMAMAAGASVPQVGSFSAARWRHAVRTPDQVAAALSLEAALNDVTHLCGPVLVSALSAVLYPAAGLTLAGCLVAVGMTAFIWQRRSEPPAHGRGDRRLVDRRLLRPSVAALFGVNMSMGLFFGAMPVAITAFAFAHHAPALAGPIAAVSSLTSLSAGLVYGARAQRLQPLTVMLAVSSLLVLEHRAERAGDVHRLRGGGGSDRAHPDPIGCPAPAHNRSGRLHPGEHLDELGQRGRHRGRGPADGPGHPTRRLAAWLPRRRRPDRDAAGHHRGRPAAIIPRDR
jgi:hypothetical protein